MIPFQYALFAYIPVAALLMMDRDRARGFSIAFVAAMLFLPAGYKVNLPAIPDLEKENVWIIGVGIGTIFFHQDALFRFRPQMIDFFLLAVLPCVVVTSLLNGFGAYDGVSRAVEFGLVYIGAIFLARIHIDSAAALRKFLLYLVGGALIYAPLALYEFRMSPQFHTWLYGYFQHEFGQHYRGGFWRPIVCFPHALVLGRFFAFAAYLALFPLRQTLADRFGTYGRFLFLLPFAGLMASQSYGPIALFFLLCGAHQLFHRMRWAGAVFPLAAALWTIQVFAGDHPGQFLVRFFEGIDVERAASLDYRMLALQEYRDNVLYAFWFGHGGWDNGRIAGLATDSQLLVSMLDRGFMGTAFYYAWWAGAILAAFRMIRYSEGRALQPCIVAIAAMGSFAISITAIDAAFEQPIMLALASVTVIEEWAPLAIAQSEAAFTPMPTTRRAPSARAMA